jgi:hypothetical protein
LIQRVRILSLERGKAIRVMSARLPQQAGMSNEDPQGLPYFGIGGLPDRSIEKIEEPTMKCKYIFYGFPDSAQKSIDIHTKQICGTMSTEKSPVRGEYGHQ